jgi:hypothetical protein
MLCKIVKQDQSFFDYVKGKGQKMPLFGRGDKTWYKLIDHIKDEDYCFSRYSITKSFIDDDNDRCYTDVPIQDKEANHLLNGHTLVVDEDHIVLDKRTKVYRNQ